MISGSVNRFCKKISTPSSFPSREEGPPIFSIRIPVGLESEGEVEKPRLSASILLDFLIAPSRN